MTRGLVLGKFYPLHVGHIGLIEFAQDHCNELILLVCASDQEYIPGLIRLQWLRETFKNNPQIKPILLNYTERDLPNSSVSSREISKLWALKIESVLGKVDIVFSSETYGEYLSEFLLCRHIMFDQERISNKVSATEIRKDVLKYWDYLAEAAKPYFVKKICIYGTESTGKSTLAERLAAYFKTDFVPEMARDIVEETEECTEQHLQQIAALQAKTIIEKIKTANKLLFVDTDINITSSYSQYLFGKKMIVENWIEEANQFDLYLYLDNDAPHIQDGTRLDERRRNELDVFHKRQLIDKGVKFELITGNWDERFEKSRVIIDDFYLSGESTRRNNS